MEHERRSFYTYAYLRLDKTPYYIGKGTGSRAYNKGHTVRRPEDLGRILILKRNLTEEEAFTHEKYMIYVFGRKDIGTGILRNKTDGGEGRPGSTPSSDTRLKVSKAKMGERNPFYGKKHTLESRLGMSQNSKGDRNPNYGKPKSPEVREKIAASNRGQKRSPETCKKLSEIGKGRKHSPEACAKISAALSKRVGERNPAFGKSWWYNTLDGTSKFSLDCPGPEWVRGRGDTLKQRPKRKWWNNGETCSLLENDPGDGWKPGKI